MKGFFKRLACAWHNHHGNGYAGGSTIRHGRPVFWYRCDRCNSVWFKDWN